ncbi:lytic transglycosylase domain-containing protein, partial [Frankia canadensis]|uniref:lytic transglycosylase domain-containing protein n=1 Tax=Frankia canadensis TaxID=1836972 RepID=UPI001FAE7C8A
MVRAPRSTGVLAALPMIGLLAVLCLTPGAVAHTATTTATAAGVSETGTPPGTQAHPPTRDYDLDLPPLQPAVQPTPPETPAGTPTPAASPASPSPSTGSPTVVLRAADRRIPDRMLTAYHRAQARLAAERPACHLRWELLAGIGRVESGHAHGRAVTADGTLTSRILGPVLDGRDGRALIRDTDDGRLDTDTQLDRAVGPMQFIPTTWAALGRDGSGDGRADPNNVDDAALTAATYLCLGGRDLTVTADLHAAIYSYNPSASYLRAVLAWTAGYTVTGVVPGPMTITAATRPPAGPPARATPSPTGPAPAGANGDRTPEDDVAPTETSSGSPAPPGTPAPPSPNRSPDRPHQTGRGESPASPTTTPRSPVASPTRPEPAAMPASPSGPLLVISMTPADGTGS